jgi:hypothetical protein
MGDDYAQLVLRVTGGIMGRSLVSSLDTRDLSEPQARTILEALDVTDLHAAANSPDWPPGAADTFVYELTVRRGNRAETVSLSDRQLPPELAPIVHALRARARPEPGPAPRPPTRHKPGTT